MLDRKQPIYTLTVEQFSELVRKLLTAKQSQQLGQINGVDNNEDMIKEETSAWSL